MFDGNRDFFFWKNKFLVNNCFEEKAKCCFEFSFVHGRIFKYKLYGNEVLSILFLQKLCI